LNQQQLLHVNILTDLLKFSKLFRVTRLYADRQITSPPTGWL